jgi:hypothetical protein
MGRALAVVGIIAGMVVVIGIVVIIAARHLQTPAMLWQRASNRRKYSIVREGSSPAIIVGQP